MFEDEYAPVDDGLLQYLLANLGGQSQPTPQPVEAAPYESLLPAYAQPTPQPTAAVPYEGSPVDLGGWSMADLNPELGNLNLVNDPGPAFDPNMVFRFDTGSGSSDGHPVVFSPGETYQMTDKSGNVIGTASTPEEMQALVAKSGDVSFYNLERTVNPTPNVDLGGMMPSKTDAGSFGSMLTGMAPIVAAAILGPMLLGPGTGGLFGAAAAPAVGAGGTAGLMADLAAAGVLNAPTALGATGAINAAIAAGTLPVGAGTGATTLGTMASLLGPEIVVPGYLGGGLTAAQLAMGTAALGTTGVGLSALTAPGGIAAPTTLTAAQTAAAQQPPVAPEAGLNEIVVTAKPAVGPAFDLAETIAQSLPAAQGLNNLYQSPSTTAQPAKGGLLNDIMKYSTYASLIGELGKSLGLGGSGGGGAATGGYGSALGPAPTLGRGAIQPFTGNYETYGFGPEWSFFSPQAPLLQQANPTPQTYVPLI